MENSNSPRPAVFLDRDGTIIEDRGYLTSPEEVVFYSKSFPALRELSTQFKLFMITNQGGISKGLQTPEQVDRVNRFVAEKLRKEGIHLQEVYTCPHQRSDNCSCIKPLPYYPLKAALDWNISLEKSWSIGDHPHDVTLAENFGGRGIYVLTGHGNSHKEELQDSIDIASDLQEAADFILTHRERVPENYISPETAAERLRAGQTVAIPTETVYGLAGDGFNEEALLKIFEAKKRPFFDPLILHCHSINQVRELILEMPDPVRKLAERFWPGPLTLVLPRSGRVSDLVTSGLDTVAVRIPSHPLARRVLELTERPLAAPSANLFGSVSPTRAVHVDRQLGERIGGIVDGGACTVGIESTIIAYWNGRFTLLRQGGVSQEEIEEITGPLKHFSSQGEMDVPAPGTMKRHYSPGTPLFLEGDPALEEKSGSLGRILFGDRDVTDASVTINLSPSGDLRDAAIHLYHSLRQLDKHQLDYIVADRLPDQGLGRAINDRLSRAAAGD